MICLLSHHTSIHNGRTTMLTPGPGFIKWSQQSQIFISSPKSECFFSSLWIVTNLRSKTQVEVHEKSQNWVLTFFERYGWIGNEFCFLLLWKFSTVIDFLKSYLLQVSLAYCMCLILGFSSVLFWLIFPSWISNWLKNYKYQSCRS